MRSRRRQLPLLRLLMPAFMLIFGLVAAASSDGITLHADRYVSAANDGEYAIPSAFDVEAARYFDLIDGEFGLTTDEMSLLEQNGFLVTDRLIFRDMTSAYAYIYWKDLPVLVTTDSILHAIHQSYDDMLLNLENYILAPELTQLLAEIRDQLKRDAAANTNPALDSVYADLDIYLTVPLSLMTVQSYDTLDYQTYVAQVQAANSVTDVDLLGVSRPIDFTLFAPRGHYMESEALTRYFQAMKWLMQIDFRFVSYDANGNPQMNIEALAAAVVLRDTLEASDQRSAWDEMETVISALVGTGDNTTLAQLDQFLADVSIVGADDVANVDADELLTMLQSGEYGSQRIVRQVLDANVGSAESVPLPVSFTLLPQRFVVDAYVLSSIVYDRLMVNGVPVQRPLPSPLDVMVALGNDRASAHLQGEFAQYGYQAVLDELRTEIDGYDAEFWSSSAYNRWLNTIRALNEDTRSVEYPPSMRTAAWADKMLQTQLASWTQLRHDNALYVEGTYTMRSLCEYPAGYVEPYPDFYAAVGEYAAAGETLFTNFDSARLEDYQLSFLQSTNAYFVHLGTVADMLQAMAEKELRAEPFSDSENAFLSSIVIQHFQPLCDGTYLEMWDGWYTELFPWNGGRDETPQLAADIHTNLNDDPSSPMYPPSVLHAATGPATMMLFMVDGVGDEGSTMYVGPALTYYEFTSEGMPPTRLNDSTWNSTLNSLLTRPDLPSWTASFRLGRWPAPRYLELPSTPDEAGR